MAISCWTGCRWSGSPSPSDVTISWPSSAAAGTRQELIAVHSVAADPSGAGRATMTEQAPHSPSAQPSLAPVRPQPRRKSSALVCSGTPSSARGSPFTTTPAIRQPYEAPSDSSEAARVISEARPQTNRRSEGERHVSVDVLVEQVAEPARAAGVAGLRAEGAQPHEVA